MRIKAQIKKWGNSLGLVIPNSVATNLKFDANTNVLLSVEENRLVVVEEKELPSLDEILDSIPEGYRHPEDLDDFLNSEPSGRELI